MSLFRPTTWDDVYFISDTMRGEDADECRAGGLTPFDALSFSVEESVISRTLLTPVTGEPAAIMGVSDSVLGPSFGSIWMLGTDALRKHKLTYLRQCKPFLNSLYTDLEKECFYNYTYCENELHHRWLQWLGFTFLRKVERPPHGAHFYEFVRLKE